MILFYSKNQAESLAVRAFVRLAGLNIVQQEENEVMNRKSPYKFYFRNFNKKAQMPFLVIEDLEYGAIGAHSIMRFLSDCNLSEDQRENFAYPKSPKIR